MALTSADLDLAALTADAGAAILAVRARSLASERKADGSPVTDADRQAEAIILAGLPAIWPGLPVVAEESAAAGMLPETGSEFVLVDPLDGTREFVSGLDEFTVNIARIRLGVPVAGIVLAPVSGDYFIASEAGGAWAARGVARGRLPLAADFRSIAVRVAGPGLTAVISRSHGDRDTEAFLAGRRIAARRSIGSSLKFCLIAQGEADIYPRFGPTMEWDTAAGDAVLRAAGGCVKRPDGSAFLYGKAAEGYRNGPFVATGAVS